MDKRPIGVLDSGIGGLTVMNAVLKLLPKEDFIYYGDNINVPYGNKTEDEIFALTMNMIDFLKEKDVKLIAIACNTISTIVERLREASYIPLIDIISPTVEHIKKMGIDKVVIMGTDFTIRTKAYEKQINDVAPKVEVFSEKSLNLAQLVDTLDFESDEIYHTITAHIDNINNQGELYNVVLACTHYPIVEGHFLEIDPNLNYINPGFQQAKAMRMYLYDKKELCNDGKGSLKIYTSGDIEVYKAITKRLELKKIKSIERVMLG